MRNSSGIRSARITLRTSVSGFRRTIICFRRSEKKLESMGFRIVERSKEVLSRTTRNILKEYQKMIVVAPDGEN